LTSLTRTPVTAAAAGATAVVVVCRDTKHSIFTHSCHMDIEVHKEHFQRQNPWPIYILYIIN
jgi:hypothetical protein